jgi:hypothetical protein
LVEHEHERVLVLVLLPQLVFEELEELVPREGPRLRLPVSGPT